MGQKVNPIGFRILNNKVWQSVWFDKNNMLKNLLMILRSENLLIAITFIVGLVALLLRDLLIRLF